MFTVKKKQGAANILWDASKKQPLCRFVNGVYTTSDKAVADRLKALGHTVTGEADKTKVGKTE